MIRKAMRTAQNYAPWLREPKNLAYHSVRQTLGLVHDRDFRFIARLPARHDDLFLDIGANRGQSILSMRHYRPDVPIVSFEPDPAMFRWLVRRFGSRTGLRLINVGLGETEGARVLHTPTYRGFAYDGLATFSRETASLYLSDKTLFGFDPERLAIAEQICLTRPLDSFNLRPTLIKIDVEGCEHEVLQGAVETLRTHTPVLLIERFYDNPSVTDLLDKLGYVEVRLRSGSFEAGATTRENMICMTLATLTSVRASGAQPRSGRKI